MGRAAARTHGGQGIDVIAQPPPSAAQQRVAGVEQPLTTEELYRLTLYKWRYSLEAFGFAGPEVSNLLFLKWLHCTRRVQP
jgi:hypothetical protein